MAIETWFLLAVSAYALSAIATSIDKNLMNRHFIPLKVSATRVLFDGLILLVIGLIFFDISLNAKLLKWSLLLGIIDAFAVVISFKILRQKDVEEVVPYAQSFGILAIFLSSIFLLNEVVNPINYSGVALILGGVYVVLSQDGFKMPRFDKSFWLILLVVFITTAYFLILKLLLEDFNPIDLAIMTLFSTAAILAAYELLFKKQGINGIIYSKEGGLTAFFASLFGSLSILLLYTALSVGDAARVFPIAGIKSVFIFLIATFFLKEKFYWHRLIGTLVVFAGIALISV